MTENEEQEEFSDDIDEDLIEESIRELMEMDSEGNEIDFNNYKRHVRELLEKLMMKFQSDLEYQKSLEYQVDVLNEECRQKDMEMEKLSNEAQAAINECRDQAEEMTENMLTRISHEVNKRASVERIVARLQKKLSSVHTEYYLKYGSGSEGRNKGSSEENLQLLNKSVEELTDLLQMYKDNFERLQNQRTQEMKAVSEISTSLNQRIIELNERAEGILQQYNHCHEENAALKQENEWLRSQLEALQRASMEKEPSSVAVEQE